MAVTAGDNDIGKSRVELVRSLLHLEHLNAEEKESVDKLLADSSDCFICQENVWEVRINLLIRLIGLSQRTMFQFILNYTDSLLFTRGK